MSESRWREENIEGAQKRKTNHVKRKNVWLSHGNACTCVKGRKKKICIKKKVLFLKVERKRAFTTSTSLLRKLNAERERVRKSV